MFVKLYEGICALWKAANYGEDFKENLETVGGCIFSNLLKNW